MLTIGGVTPRRSRTVIMAVAAAMFHAHPSQGQTPPPSVSALKLVDAPSLLDYGAQCNATYSTATVSIAANSANLTASSPLFNAGQLGQTILLTGAGATASPLVTTIKTFNSSTSVTLNSPAQTTLSSSAQTVIIGTDDSTAVTAAGNSTKARVTIPRNLICLASTVNQAMIPAFFSGPGQVATSDGNLRGPIVVQINTTPGSRGASNIVQNFNGDISHVPIAIEHRVNTGVFPAPPTIYDFMDELVAVLISDYFAGGGDIGITPNTQRTGYATQKVNLSHVGQGDATAYFASLFVQGPNPKALPQPNQTSFLSGPAGSIVGGSLVAGAPGVYLQGLGDINLNDGGYDVAAVGSTINLTRTNGTGALGNTWIGYRIQSASTGTIVPDAAFSAGGRFKIGLDLADATNTQAAVVMAAGQRYYVNATQPSSIPFPNTVVLGTEWWDYSATKGWEFVVGSTPLLSFGNNNAQFTSGPGQTNSGIGSTTIGAYNSVAGTYATAFGGAHYLTANATTAMGQSVNDRGNIGATCSASGQLVNQGDAQSCTYTLRASSSSTTPIRLTADGLAVTASGHNTISIPVGALYGLDIEVVARDTSVPGSWSQWHVAGASLYRDSAGVSYSGPAPVQTGGGSGSTAVLALGADTANAALSIAFTAPNSNTWHVVATVRTAEVQ